jgi:hypothetical protein
MAKATRECKRHSAVTKPRPTIGSKTNPEYGSFRDFFTDNIEGIARTQNSCGKPSLFVSDNHFSRQTEIILLF